MPDTEVRMELVVPSVQKLFRPGVIVLLALMCLGTFLMFHYPRFTQLHLFLRPEFSLALTWQLLTYSFVDSPFNLLICGLAVLFFGSMIERDWRTTRFLLLWVVCSVGCGLVWILIMHFLDEIPLMGNLPCFYGLLIAFALLFRRQRMMWGLGWGIEAQTICWILIGGTAILSVIFQVESLICLSGLLIAWIYVKLRTKMAGRRSRIPAQSPIRTGGFVDVD